MARTKKNENDEVKALSVELKKEVKKLSDLLNKLETNIGLLQTGASWNGANAYDVNQALLGHFDHDKNLLKKLEKCSEDLEAIVK